MSAPQVARVAAGFTVTPRARSTRADQQPPNPTGKRLLAKPRLPSFGEGGCQHRKALVPSPWMTRVTRALLSMHRCVPQWGGTAPCLGSQEGLGQAGGQGQESARARLCLAGQDRVGCQHPSGACAGGSQACEGGSQARGFYAQQPLALAGLASWRVSWRLPRETHPSRGGSRGASASAALAGSRPSACPSIHPSAVRSEMQRSRRPQSPDTF